jgi:hypothetical protein
MHHFRMLMFTATLFAGLFSSSPSHAAWVDDFDDGDPLTNPAGIGWTNFFASGPVYEGYSYPYVAEPGRDGAGSIELASAAGNQILNTTEPIPELDFFTAPTRLKFEHVNNQKYQAGDLQAGVGGFSFVYSYLFLGSTQGRSGGGAGMNDLITVDLLGAARYIRLASRKNGAQAELGRIEFLTDDPLNPVQFGDITVSNMHTYTLDLDAVNVTLTVTDETSGLFNVLTVPHGLTLEDWNAGTGGAYVGMASDSQQNTAPPAGPRASTLSVGKVTAGIVESIAADFNEDGVVDGADFLAWQRGFGISDGSAGPADGDANDDGNVDAADLDLWKTNFGPGGVIAAVAAVPEPRVGILAAMAASLICAARRRGDCGQ